MDTCLNGKRILILQQRGWALTIGHFLAKKLQAEGCRLAAITLKRSTDEFVRSQTDVRYDLLMSNDEVMEDPKKFLREETVSLEEVCRELGVDSVWPIVMTLRHHVRSYKDKFYYGFKQNVPDEEIVDYVKATYLYIRRIFRDFNPDVILTPNFVALPHIMLNLYAAKRGVKMVGVTDAKVKGIFIFSHSYRDDAGPFYDRVDELNDRRAESPNRERAKTYIEEFRKEFKRPSYLKNAARKTLWKRIRHELSPYRLIWKWVTDRPVNHLKNLGITADYRPPRIILRDFYAGKRYRRYAERFPYVPLEQIGKCIYFPLQFQPEATIDVIAPYFSNQIETARLIAMSLPDDYTLVVKEHPEMVGLRPPSYLEKIARTPNVKLIDWRIPSDVVIKKADLIVSANSTTLAEAAFYNKPAIQLGNLGTTLKMPHVVKHSDVSTISTTIRERLRADLRTPDYERRLENFVAAAYDTGFDIPYVSVWEGKDAELLNPLWETYRQEIASSF
ncbi:hypothetical protein HY479_00520 [Candidatus Uhrbacteria bacterium]|nr:hypothetical protein [Candidatus Uhrbacteria bacterium]